MSCVGYAKVVNLNYQQMALAHLQHVQEPGKQFNKMALPLQQCTEQEQRSVVRFLFSEGMKPIEIHRQMIIQCDDRCMSHTQVYEWTEQFKNSVTSVEDSPRPGPAVTEDNITAVENVIRENRRVTVKEMASLLDISVGSAHHIIHDEPKFRKVCARWYPSDWHLK